MMEIDDNDEYEGRASIVDIPEEILEHILSHLSPYRDFKSAMQVCKQWRRIMTGAAQHQYQLFHRSIREGSTAWTTLTPDTCASISERYAHTACYHEKCMYVFGGCTSSSTTFNDLWRFDLATRQWIRPLAIGTYPSPKACASMLSHRGHLILFGGWSHPSPYPLHQASRFFNQLHMYTPSTNRWSLVTPRTNPPPTAGHSASILGNKMIIFGGSHGYGVSCNELWVLDLDEMNWYKKETPSPVPKPRYGQSQVVLDSSHLLIIGGCGGPNMQYTDIWILALGAKEDEWRWREMKIQNPELSPSNLWCHPACKVGDKVAVFSKSNKVSLRESIHKPSVQPAATPPKSSKLWIPPRQDEIKSNAGTGHSTCQQCGGTTYKSRNNMHCGSSKRRLPDSSESSHDDSSSDIEDGASLSTVTAHTDKAGLDTRLSDDIGTQSTSTPHGGHRVCASSSSSSSDPAIVKHTSPVRPGMPSIRPNAMKNRQRQLETLKLYEDKIRNASLRPKCNHGNPHHQRAQNEGRSTQQPVQTKPKSSNPMYLHVLDVSQAVGNALVTWQPIRQNIGPYAPDETIFYSVVEGRGELILFGGIQTDLGSMQRVMMNIQQKVSNQVHFVHAVKTLL